MRREERGEKTACILYGSMVPGDGVYIGRLSPDHLPVHLGGVLPAEKH